MADVTELTVHQQLATTIEDSPTKSNSNTGTNNNDAIFLGDRMDQISDSQMFKISKTLYKTLPFNVVIFSLYLVCTTADTELTPECALSAPKQIAILAFYSLLLLVTVSVMVYGKCISQLPFKDYANKICGFDSLTPDDRYDFNMRYYAGNAFLLCTAYTLFVSLLGELFLAFLQPASARCVIAALNVVFFVLSKRVHCQQDIAEAKQSILVRYPRLKDIEARLDQRLIEWKSSQYLDNRRAEFAILCGFVFCIQYFSAAVLDWGLWRDSWSVIVVNTVLYATDAVAFSYLLFSIHTLYLHYRLPSMIMVEFASSIHCKHIDELIGWWELRKFYIDCVVKVYFSYLHTLISGALLICITLCGFLFARIVIDKKMDLDNVQLAIWMIYVVVYSFMLIGNAANYNATQSSHVHMITKELMLLERYQMGTDTKHVERESMRYIGEQMKAEVLGNKDAMRALGIKIDTTFVLFLRASIGSAFIGIISVVIS